MYMISCNAFVKDFKKKNGEKNVAIYHLFTDVKTEFGTPVKLVRLTTMCVI